MDLNNIEDWTGFCDAVEKEDLESSQRMNVLGEGWAIHGITPPPALAGLARIPLERARECERAAVTVPGLQAKRRFLRRALRWLELPHPRAPENLVRRMGSERKRLERVLEGL